MSIWNNILKMFSGNPVYFEVPSPRIRLKDTDTVVDNGQVVFKNLKPGVILQTVADTGSMDPFIDIGMLVILEPATDVENYIEGDIICYQPNDKPELILHRITKIGHDGLGWWCYCKGDNCVYTDRYVIRSDWVKYIFRGVLT